MNASTAETQILTTLNPLVGPLGYEVIHVELGQNPGQRTRVLRLFIDFADSHQERKSRSIGIEDCVRVTRALDPEETGEPARAGMELIDQVLKGAPYELEVSSPGIDRPLRTAKDFARFVGEMVRVTTLRALTGDELCNAEYGAKNPRQKNFLGTLEGLTADSGAIRLAIALGGSSKEAGTTKGPEVTLPFPLIAKANLEPFKESL